MNILIVDDTKFNIMTAKEVIKISEIKCDIITAASGEEAIEIVNTQNIEIILLDIVMPKLSGIETLEIIRRNNKNVIILMFTSLTDKKYLEKSFEFGANDYINKPIEPIEFASRLKSAIKMREYQNALMESYNNLKNTNAQLKESNAKLKTTQIELVNKEKLSTIGRFSAGIAHEINTPLGYVTSNIYTIQSYAKTLKEYLDKYLTFIKENEEYFSDKKELEELSGSRGKLEFILSDFEPVITETNEGLEKISSIIKNIIRFSNEDAYDNFEMNKFSELIEESMKILKMELKEYKLDDLFDLELNLIDDDYIKCNRFQIEQVIFNIIKNSIYYIGIKDKKGSIKIKTYKELEYFCLEIRDDGTGIEEENINKIFDPFFTTKEPGEGTGLGLSICYDIVVVKHKGHLLAQSVYGEGAAIIMKLPL